MVMHEVREILNRLQEYDEAPVPREELLVALGVISEAASAYCDANFAKAMMTIHQAGTKLPKGGPETVRKALHRAVQSFGGQEAEFRRRAYAALSLLGRVDPASAGEARSLFESAVRAEVVLVDAALDANAGNVSAMIRHLEGLDGLLSAAARQSAHPRFKICLLGEGAVGKTSLIRRYVTGRFGEKYDETIGARITYKEVDDAGGRAANVALWDIMGHELLGRLRQSFILGAHGVALVVSLSDRGSIESAREWIKLLDNTVGRVPIALIANKCDLGEPEKEARQFEELAAEFDTSVVRTSAKTGENVKEVFDSLVSGLGRPTVGELPDGTN